MLIIPATMGRSRPLCPFVLIKHLLVKFEKSAFKVQRWGLVVILLRTQLYLMLVRRC